MLLHWSKFATVAALMSLPVLAQQVPPPAPKLPSNQQVTNRPSAVPTKSVPVAGTRAPQLPAAQGKPTAAAAGKSSHSAKTVAVKGRRGKKVLAKAPVPAPVPVPEPPPPPLTPEQQNPVPAQISYLNGQLAIQSTNATLSSILSAVGQQTGAQIDLPPGAGNERVATRVGPGSARDVLVSLLGGSAFDYVILGNPDSPGSVQRVILTVKSNAGAGVNMATMAQRPVVPPPTPAADDSSDEEQADTPDTADQEQPSTEPTDQQADQQAQPAPAAVAQPTPPTAQVPPPVQQQSGDQQQPAAPGPSTTAQPDQQGNAGPQIKTPEQLYQELQKLQQAPQKQ